MKAFQYHVLMFFFFFMFIFLIGILLHYFFLPIIFIKRLGFLKCAIIVLKAHFTIIKRSKAVL